LAGHRDRLRRFGDIAGGGERLQKGTLIGGGPVVIGGFGWGEVGGGEREQFRVSFQG
jgi:hypothetical protein